MNYALPNVVMIIIEPQQYISSLYLYNYLNIDDPIDFSLIFILISDCIYIIDI